MPPHPNAHLRHNNHPVAQSAPPLRRGELYPATVRSQFPSIGWVGAGWGGLLVTRECVARARCALCVSSYLFGLHFV